MPRLAVFALLIAAMAWGPPAEARHRHHHAVHVQPIIVAAEPEAARAGMDVLRRGGTAADAAVAVQAVLALIEPQSSSLAGGAFMLYYDAATGELTDYNGRETAPAGAAPDMFLGPDGKPLPFATAVVSGRATGVPGALFMLDQAQKDHGRLAWTSLFGAAEALATDGFTVTPRLGYDLQETDYDFAERHTADVNSYFSDGKGGRLKTGDTLKNPAYAATLRTIVARRSEALRSGPIAEAIVARTHDDPLAGTMTLADIAAYKVGIGRAKPTGSSTPVAGKPLCAPYHLYIVCTNNAPSGGPALLQGLRIAENLPLAQWGVHDPRAWQGLIESERLMYADRDQYEGDTSLFASQEATYLDAGYARARAALIETGKAGAAPQPGDLGAAGRDNTLEPGGTTHVVIRDRYGNVLSMTTTVESLFGTGRMVDGFFLNNQLTDFSFSPWTAGGSPVANAVAPGKHPRSSMSPVIVFDKAGHVVAAVGSPGGTSIIAYNLKVLIGVLDWHLSMQDAINLPNIVARGDAIRVEKARMEPAVWDGLVRMGYSLTATSGEESGLNGILRQPDMSFDGGSDPRREGVVVKGE